MNRVDEIDTDREQCWLWLCSIPGLYSRQLRMLTEYFGSPRAVYEAPDKEFGAWKEKNVKWIQRLLDFKKRCSPEEVCHRATERGIEFRSCEHPDFPGRLKEISDCPAGLFYLGELPCPDVPAVAVVGARECSDYGKIMAVEISEGLANAGVQVISGLALGIDGYAQRAALAAEGKSYGVLGCGADVCYPWENRRLYLDVQRQGGIISEFPQGTRPLSYHFPMRNRIISGLCDAVVVVEAREKSGSLITADLALEQGRDVYAVPGRIQDALSSGCNRLIAQGAGIVLSPEHLLEELYLQNPKQKIQNKNQLTLAPEEKRVYSNLDLSPKGPEEIAAKSEVSVDRIGGILLNLLLKGLAEESSKNHYIRVK